MRVVRSILRTVGWLISVVVLYLLTVALMPGFPEPRQPLTPKPRDPDEDDSSVTPFSGHVEDVCFLSSGAEIRGRFYLPSSDSALMACIVMAHGLGGTVEMGLDYYARRFAEAGYAVLTFDYRCFGRSEGEPRQLVWIPSQLEDWEQAIRYVRRRPEIDPKRVALWGTSLSSGHVLVTAAADPEIVCVSAQNPMLDGRVAAEETLKRLGWRRSATLIMHAQRDLVRSWLHLSPHKIPIVDKQGSVALIADPEAWDAFRALAPVPFVNEACARIMVRFDKYRPIRKADNVNSPILLQICEKDQFTPLSAVDEACRRLGDLAEVKRYPISHFDIYFDEWLEKAVTDQLAFYQKNL